VSWWHGDGGVKVRIGYGLGTGGVSGDAEGFAAMVDAMERHRFDSLWLSERITGGAFDPIVAAAFAAGRTTKLKIGFSVLVVPGRNPYLLAKELASLDRLSNGRLLPAVGLGVADPAEQKAFGVDRKERVRIFDHALSTMRRLWAGEEVEGVKVKPLPVQQPMDVWLGGRAPGELRRVGRVGDGWLPSFCTPADVEAGRKVVEEAATEAGREMDPEHWGALIPYGKGPLNERIAALLAVRQPDVDPSDVVPSGMDAIKRHLQRFIDVGFSKFVLVPAFDVTDWDAELAEVAEELLPLQT
jgi:probable F420-dependent oxidoreductase